MNIELQEYADSYASQVVHAFLYGVDDLEAKFGKEFRNILMTSMIKSLINSIVYEFLIKNATESTTEDKKVLEYRQFKMEVQNAIGDGFSEAFNTFTKGNTDYMCDILPLPDPANKLPC